jgi:RNA polymerase sigma-70 factor (ECF subfamily)
MSDHGTQSGCRLNPATTDGACSISAAGDGELLLEYARSGSQQAFEEIVSRYRRKIYRYLCRYLGDAQLAEDALQATFLQVHLKCGLFEAGRGLSPWLFRIATNQANDLLRRNRRHKAVSLDAAPHGGDSLQESRSPGFSEPSADLPASRLESTEERERVWTAMDRLPQATKQLLILVKCRGLKYQEVAQLLGIPLGTVKSRMNEALRRLRRALTASRPAPR